MTDTAAARVESGELKRPSAWTRFWSRFLPQGERRDVLWMLIGGTAITVGASSLASALARAIVEYLSRRTSAIPATEYPLLKPSISFVLITLAVFVAIRFLRAPKTLALYVAVAALVTAVISLLGVPNAIVIRALAARDGATGSSQESVFGVLLGVFINVLPAIAAALGAWAATALPADSRIVERMSGAGYSEPEPVEPSEADDETSDRPPGPRAIAALVEATGFSVPLDDRARVAAGLALVVLIPALFYILLNTVSSIAAFVAQEPFIDTSRWMKLLFLGLWALSWTFSAWLIVRRRGPRGTWLVPFAQPTLLPSIYYNLVAFARAGSLAGESLFYVQALALELAATTTFVAASLFGVWLATRGGSSATLPAEGDGGAVPPSSHPRSQEEANG